MLSPGSRLLSDPHRNCPASTSPFPHRFARPQSRDSPQCAGKNPHQEWRGSQENARIVQELTASDCRAFARQFNEVGEWRLLASQFSPTPSSQGLSRLQAAELQSAGCQALVTTPQICIREAPLVPEPGFCGPPGVSTGAKRISKHC